MFSYLVFQNQQKDKIGFENEGLMNPIGKRRLNLKHQVRQKEWTFYNETKAFQVITFLSQKNTTYKSTN